MRQEGRLAEFRLASLRFDGRGDARQFAEQHIFPTQRQRDERGARLDHLEAELARQIVRKAGRAHLGNRRTARGNYQRWRAVRLAVRLDAEPVAIAPDPCDLLTSADFDVALFALRQQHRDDLFCRTVAEQLAERLFVPRNPVALDQVEEIARGVPRERGFGEMAIGREVVVGPGAQIGEIAPPAARDEDFLPHRLGLFEHQHAPPALPGDRGAEQSRSSAAQYDRIMAHAMVRGRSLPACRADAERFR